MDESSFDVFTGNIDIAKIQKANQIKDWLSGIVPAGSLSTFEDKV
jgi:hypothetical protein